MQRIDTFSHTWQHGLRLRRKYAHCAVVNQTSVDSGQKYSNPRVAFGGLQESEKSRTFASEIMGVQNSVLCL